MIVSAKTAACKSSHMTVAGWSKHSHATWKAIVRRDGVFSNETTNCDWNEELVAPLVASIAPQWEQAFSTDLETIFTDFAVRARKKVKDFHASIPELLSPFGINSKKSYKRLEGQHTGYKQAFAEAEDVTCDYINSQQRIINRNFKPLVGESMRPAYVFCVAVQGSGSFVKMRAHMKQYMEENQHMFRDATKAVQKQLDRMLFRVKDILTAEVEKIHVDIVKDYTETLCGNDKDDENHKTDSNDVFVNQISYFLEQCQKSFQRPKDEHYRRLNKFGSIFAPDKPMQPHKESEPTIVVDDDEEDVPRGNDLPRDAFSVASRPNAKETRSEQIASTKDSSALASYRDRQRGKYSRAPTTSLEGSLGGAVDLKLVKPEPKDDDGHTGNSSVLSSVEIDSGQSRLDRSDEAHGGRKVGEGDLGTTGSGNAGRGSSSSSSDGGEGLFVRG